MFIQNDRARQRRQKWLGVLALFAVLVLAFFFWKPLGGNTVSADFGEDSLLLSSPDGSVSHEIPYGDVLSVETLFIADFGNEISGTQDGSCVFGIWQNDTLGTYWLFANTNVNLCMLITTKDGTVTAVNLGTESVTKETASSFQELLEEYG